MEFNPKILGQNIRHHRGLANMTQKELADLVRVTQPYIAKLENGAIEDIGLDNLALIAEALGITLDILLSDFLTVYNQQDTIKSKANNDLLSLLNTLDTHELKEFHGIVAQYILLQKKKLKKADD